MSIEHRVVTLSIGKLILSFAKEKKFKYFDWIKEILDQKHLENKREKPKTNSNLLGFFMSKRRLSYIEPLRSYL